MTTRRNPAMALLESIQFLLSEVVKFDMNPANVQKAASLSEELKELETFEVDFAAAEQERVAFFEEQASGTKDI